MDNGPECSGRRSQFLHRMTKFVDSTGLIIHLVYYPPYHSKYNSIERYWAGLEKSWNGYLLDTVTTVINRACNFFGRGIQTTVKLVDAASIKRESNFWARRKLLLKLVYFVPGSFIGVEHGNSPFKGIIIISKTLIQ